MTKKEQRLAIYNKFDGHCAYCGELINLTRFEVDHLIPILRGYKNRNVDTFENMMPSCVACNRGKGGYKLENWRMMLENKITELNRDVAAYRTAKRFGLVKETDVRIKFYFERGLQLTVNSKRRFLTDLNNEIMMKNRCEAGCKIFTGGEIKHHPDCQYYDESMSKIYDDLQSKVEKLPIHGVINWAYFNDDKPNYGDQILIQDPPEQMSTPRVEIYDRNTTWIDGSRYAVITPCL